MNLDRHVKSMDSLAAFAELCERRCATAYDSSTMHASQRSNLPDKPCAVCGRPITWRKKWARCWEEIRVCSDACRAARKRSAAGADTIENAICAKLNNRDKADTICPSEVARDLFPDDWRERMEDVRRAARRLESRGVVVGKQSGQRVDLATARGPIRIGRGRAFES